MISLDDQTIIRDSEVGDLGIVVKDGKMYSQFRFANANRIYVLEIDGNTDPYWFQFETSANQGIAGMAVDGDDLVGVVNFGSITGTFLRWVGIEDSQGVIATETKEARLSTTSVTFRGLVKIENDFYIVDQTNRQIHKFSDDIDDNDDISFDESYNVPASFGNFVGITAG